MIRAEMHFECRICTRPFTVFRWRPGRDARYKCTVICQTCCKLKNVCQTCLFDLEYGLPVQVRDAWSPANEVVSVPQSEVMREWFIQQQEKRFAEGGQTVYAAPPPGKMDANHEGVKGLMKMRRTTPYYKRNRPHICSFYVKGECTRGQECPYRHEMPDQGELADQNVKDRYYGVNDPVAKKIFRIYEEGKQTPGAKIEGAANPDAAVSSSSAAIPSVTIPLPPGNPMPASYYRPVPAPGNPNAPQAYPAQSSAWVGH